MRVADAAKAVVVNLGAPNVVIRESDTVQPRDTYPLVIITLGEEILDPQLDVMGGPSANDQGDIGVQYQIGFSMYREQLGDIAADDVNQSLVQLSQQKLGRAYPLPAVPSVYDGRLVRRDAWEGQEFVTGVEVSRFAVIFHNAEPRCG